MNRLGCPVVMAERDEIPDLSILQRHTSVNREGYVSILRKGGNAMHSNKVVPRFIEHYN